ncbi:MAG TPA: MFS transporter [Bacteroidales bacterium]|nr:MFS transporter [Bacteroidales bacterium]
MNRKFSHPNNKRSRYFGFDRNIFFTGITSFLTDTSIKMVYSVMPLFLLSIGASKTTLSLIEGIAESTASLLKAVSGFWSDRVGRNKPFMIIGYGLTALVTPLYAGVISPLQVLFLRFAERIGKGLRTAPRDSLISASIQKNEAGKSFGFHKAMDNSGAIIGPLIAFLFLALFPLKYEYIFIAAGLPALLGVISVIVFIREARTDSGSTKVRLSSWKQLPRNYFIVLGILFIFSLGNSTDALLLVKTSESGVKSTYIPFIYMIFNSVSVLLAIPAGKLSDRIGREKLITWGFLVYALVYFLFGTFSSIPLLILAFVFYGVYSAFSDGSQKALISDLTGTAIKGTGFGIYHAMLGITLLPASLIAGLLYDRVTPAAAFYFGGAMAILAASLMALFQKAQKRKLSVSN